MAKALNETLKRERVPKPYSYLTEKRDVDFLLKIDNFLVSRVRPWELRNITEWRGASYVMLSGRISNTSHTSGSDDLLQVAQSSGLWRRVVSIVVASHDWEDGDLNLHRREKNSNLASANYFYVIATRMNMTCSKLASYDGDHSVA
jgi:hypothetical protein